jgi:hypothetical protein
MAVRGLAPSGIGQRTAIHSGLAAIFFAVDRDFDLVHQVVRTIALSTERAHPLCGNTANEIDEKGKIISRDIASALSRQKIEGHLAELIFSPISRSLRLPRYARKISSE